MREIVAFRPLGLVLAAVMSVVSIVHPALGAAGGAAAGDETAALEAKRHYEEGTKAFNLGEFPRAISEFKAAYNAKAEPLLLYNIAQSYRLAGDPTQAVFFYKSFLRNMPAATNRKDVEAQIRKLEKQIDQSKREPAPTLLSPAPALAAPNPSVPAAVPTPKPASASASASASDPAATPTASPAADAGKPLVGTATASSAAAKSMTGATPGPLSAPARSEPSSSAALRLDSPPPPASVELTMPEPARPEEPRPIYKKWWFWAGAAGVIVIVGGLVAASAKKAPDTTLGNYNPMFTM